MGRPCNHRTNLEPGKPYVTDTCRCCWLYFNNPKYRKMWGDDEEGIVAAPTRAIRRKRCNCRAKKKITA